MCTTDIITDCFNYLIVEELINREYKGLNSEIKNLNNP